MDTVANHFLYFAPDKIAVEFETSMFFAGFYLLIGVGAGMIFVQFWRDRGTRSHRAA